MSIILKTHWCEQCFGRAWRQVGGRWLCDDCIQAAQSQTGVSPVGRGTGIPDPFQAWVDYYQKQRRVGV